MHDRLTRALLRLPPPPQARRLVAGDVDSPQAFIVPLHHARKALRADISVASVAIAASTPTAKGKHGDTADGQGRVVVVVLRGHARRAPQSAFITEACSARHGWWCCGRRRQCARRNRACRPPTCPAARSRDLHRYDRSDSVTDHNRRHTTPLPPYPCHHLHSTRRLPGEAAVLESLLTGSADVGFVSRLMLDRLPPQDRARLHVLSSAAFDHCQFGALESRVPSVTRAAFSAALLAIDAVAHADVLRREGVRKAFVVRDDDDGQNHHKVRARWSVDDGHTLRGCGGCLTTWRRRSCCCGCPRRCCCCGPIAAAVARCCRWYGYGCYCCCCLLLLLPLLRDAAISLLSVVIQIVSVGTVLVGVFCVSSRQRATTWFARLWRTCPRSSGTATPGLGSCESVGGMSPLCKVVVLMLMVMLTLMALLLQ